MNSQTILLGLLLLVVPIKNYACDACGCSMIFWDIGMIPQFEAHQLSMRWQNQAFHSFSSIENKQAAQDWANGLTEAQSRSAVQFTCFLK